MFSFSSKLRHSHDLSNLDWFFVNILRGKQKQFFNQAVKWYEAPESKGKVNKQNSLSFPWVTVKLGKLTEVLPVFHDFSLKMNFQVFPQSRDPTKWEICFQLKWMNIMGENSDKDCNASWLRTYKILKLLKPFFVRKLTSFLLF